MIFAKSKVNTMSEDKNSNKLNIRDMCILLVPNKVMIFLYGCHGDEWDIKAVLKVLYF